MLMHTLELEDLEALRRLDCQIASLLGWQDAGLHFDGAGDVLGDYLGVPPGEGVARRVPHYCTDPVAAAGLPVTRRVGKVIYFTPTPLTVALLFLEQATDVKKGSTSQDEARSAN